MSSVLDIRRAFEKSLKSIDPNFPTAYENSSFNSTRGVAYQSCQLIPNKPDNPAFGDLYRRETGSFQVFLCYDAHKGTSESMQKAIEIQNFYHRGKTLTEGTTEVIILGTPTIAGAMITDDRYIIPILIEYYSNIN
jgi:Bacteriophage related domain of unknown function